MEEIIRNYASKVADIHAKEFVRSDGIHQDIQLYKVNACYLIAIKFYYDREDRIYNHFVNLIRSDCGESVEYLTGYGESPNSITSTIEDILRWNDIIPTE